jgi:hypothetical protein
MTRAVAGAAAALGRDFADDELAVLVGVDPVEAGARGLKPFGAGDLAILVGIPAKAIPPAARVTAMPPSAAAASLRLGFIGVSIPARWRATAVEMAPQHHARIAATL